MQLSSTLLYNAAKAGVFLIQHLPRGAARGLGYLAGLAGWLLAPTHRKTAALQMRSALGEGYSRSLPLRVFRHHARVLVDAVRYAGMDTAAVRQHFDIEGREHLEAALASARGVLLAEGHLGNWEMTTHMPRVLGFDCDIIMNERKDPGLEALIQELRHQPGVTKLPPRGGVMKAMIATLKAGRTVFMAVDQRGPRGNTLVCDFLGLPALTTPVPAYIAIKGDALVVPMSIIAVAGRYRVRFEPAIDPRDFCPDPGAITGLRDAMQAEPVQRLSAVIQNWLGQLVRQHPTQWIWLYSRWIRRSELRRVLSSGADFGEYVLSQSAEYKQIWHPLT